MKCNLTVVHLIELFDILNKILNATDTVTNVGFIEHKCNSIYLIIYPLKM